MKIPLTITEFIILSLAIQSMVMAIVLLYRSNRLNGNGWLSAIILSISFIAVVRIVSGCLHLEDTYPWITPLLFQPVMLVGPFIYFYARSLIYGKIRLRAKHAVHLLPVIKGAGPQIAFILFYSGLLSLPFIQSFYFTATAQLILFNVYLSDNLPLFISLLTYSILSYRLVRKHEAGASASTYKLKDIKWLKNLLRLFLSLVVLFAASLILNMQPIANRDEFTNAIFFIPLTGFTYWLSISSFLRQGKMTPDDVVTYNKVPARVYFSDEDAARHGAQLLALMIKDKPYLDPLLKLDTLAARLNITERAFSNLLNQHVGKSFNDFVNEYRVEAAKLKLADPNFDQYTIAAIAYECGFNSLATFQRCFKQFAGITPSQFLQQRKAGAQLVQQQ
ncbi:helix-turn-helix domain-containing protein [Mucilaginibacter auburnensis]|nr:helix-turn-helix domain-containing protein [Mucilaginibacter auburnensis]